jgi:type IV pilus assembly protein PilV
VIKFVEKTGDRGFTLIEILVAVSILSVGVLGMAALQGTSIRQNAFSMRTTEATALIESKIEEYRNIAYASIPVGDDSEADLGTGGQFTRTSSVQKDTPVNDVKTVTIQVSWSDPGVHTVSYRTVISK